jgi:hypothetical protein
MPILLIIFAEWLLIALIGLCGTLAFISSGIYEIIHNFMMSHYPDIGQYFIGIIWGFIALTGIFSISFRRKGGGRLTWIAIFFSLPSILAFNKIDLGTLVGLQSKLTTSLSFWQAATLSIIILVAYILINFMREFKLFRLGLINKNVDSQDVQNITVQSHIILVTAMLCTLILSAITGLLAINLESRLLPFFKSLPTYLFPIGCVCLLMLAVYIYWLGTHYSSSDKN